MSGNSRTIPSTIWATLALGLSPIGSIPFVDTDGQSITTDILHFYYTALGAASATIPPYSLTAWGGLRLGSTTISIPSIQATLNKPAGKFTIPAACASGFTLYNSYINQNSIVIPVIMSEDNTLAGVQAIPFDGGCGFTFIPLNTSTCSIGFVVFNTDSTGP